VFRARSLLIILICIICLIGIIDPTNYASQYYNDQQRASSVVARLSIFQRDPETANTTETPPSMSVLEDTIPENTAQHQLQLKDALFPVSDPTRKTGAVWMDENHRRLKALFTCISLENCAPNQGKGMFVLHLACWFQLLAPPSGISASTLHTRSRSFCPSSPSSSRYSSFVSFQGWIMGLDWWGGPLVRVFTTECHSLSENFPRRKSQP